MLTQTIDAAHLASAVAAAAGPALAPGSALVVGEAQSAPVDVALDYAVICPIGGEVSGELVLYVDESFGRALVTSDIGELDLGDALAPTLQHIAADLGAVLLGTPTTVDARIAQQRINGRADMAVVGLDDGAAIRAAVAVGLDTTPIAVAPVAAAPTSYAPAAPSSERLDLLRHVEMSATVELGRAKMTINDLLSLRDGAIIELDRAAGEAADLFVNGRLIARGEVVVVDENYALRLTQIVTDEPGR